MSNKPGAYAPAVKTIAFREALARCDAQQAAELRKWAERIEGAAAVVAAVGGAAHDLMQIANEMKNTAFVVERFTAEILDCHECASGVPHRHDLKGG